MPPEEPAQPVETLEQAAAPSPTPSAPQETVKPAPPGSMVVGLGASSGGIETLSTFLEHMPADTGLSFVIITHQPSGRISGLVELLARHTAMPVLDVAAVTPIEPNHVYVAPPGRYLTIQNMQLHPSEAQDQKRLVMPIDMFFGSLAEQYQERAAAIVLSGTGTDGTRGLKHVRAHLGVTMVQEEETARFAGMPHSAILGESPDFVLPVEAMAKELLAYAAQLEAGKSYALDVPPELAADELQSVLTLLRARLGHDFSAYKDSTVRRRVERRMNIYHLDAVSQYVKYLKRHPEELDRLFEELLIGVTAFFRDPEAFTALEPALLELVSKSDGTQTIRVWVAGCSTGEEAYSIAILLKEAMENLGRTQPVQIFATDLDIKAIEFARHGVYHISAAADLGPRRLSRFFVREQDSVRVRKELRELIVFAVQNVAEDPPLTRIDLISCRNLLIYFGASLQKRLVPLFHHALRSEGLLLLGSSESVGTFTNLFDAVDKKAKLFRRKDVAYRTHAADLTTNFTTELGGADVAPQRGPRRAELPAEQVTERALLRELVPPTVIIRERGDIVHIHGRTGQFLEPAPGPQTSVNLFGMAREGLQLELAAAVRQASREEGEVLRRGVSFLVNGTNMLVDLKLRRLNEPDSLRGMIAVSFERLRALEAGADSTDAPRSHVTAPHMLELERELLYTKESLQSTIAELETANEEMTSTNEELQSTNEELQSTNEELETSKEELQSLNEELQTVNTELQAKVEELSRANDDMTNLLNATDIATLFLDNDLNIKRHTQQTKKIIPLIPSDVGRPIGDLVSTLRYDSLVEDAQTVLRTLSFKETEVQADGGHWYLMRIMPYRTTDHMIDGLVITFVDISRVKELQQSEERLIAAIHDSPIRVFGEDASQRFVWACSGLFGLSQEQVLGKTAIEVLGEENSRSFRDLTERVLQSGKALRERLSLRVLGTLRDYDVHVKPQLKDGKLAGTSLVMVDVTAEPT